MAVDLQSKTLNIPAQVPAPKDNRWNKALYADLKRALDFSKLKYHGLHTGISPNSNILAPVRTISWWLWLDEPKPRITPYISSGMRQRGAPSNLEIIKSVRKVLTHNNIPILVMLRLWVFIQWCQLTKEIE